MAAVVASLSMQLFGSVGSGRRGSSEDDDEATSNLKEDNEEPRRKVGMKGGWRPGEPDCNGETGLGGWNG